MGSLNVYKILGTGVIGLGFLLALLAYRLLARAQSQSAPNKSIVRAVYAFMCFAVVLCLLGLASQFIDNADVARLKRENEVQKINLDRYRERQAVRLSINQRWKGFFDTAMHLMPTTATRNALTEIRDEIAFPPVKEETLDGK